MPAAVFYGDSPGPGAGDEAVGFGWPPRSRLVDDHRRGMVEDWLDHPPGLLHRVLAGEAPGVARDGVVEEPFVGIGGIFAAEGVGRRDEVGGAGHEIVAPGFDLQGEADRFLGPETEAHVVGVGAACARPAKSSLGGELNSTSTSVALAASFLPART